MVRQTADNAAELRRTGEATFQLQKECFKSLKIANDRMAETSQAGDKATKIIKTIDEIAFLSLEIDRLGHPDLAAELVRRYCAAVDDPAAPAIVSFYRSHRAATRAKLAAWHLGDPLFPDPRPWIARAESYLRDAERHAHEAIRILDAEGSLRIGGRPATKQRRDRRPARHARDRRPEERRDGQDGNAAGT